MQELRARTYEGNGLFCVPPYWRTAALFDFVLSLDRVKLIVGGHIKSVHSSFSVQRKKTHAH